MKKSGAGRPKKDKKEKKSEIISARLTESQKEEIIALFGSIDEFIRVAIIKVVNNKKG